MRAYALAATVGLLLTGCQTAPPSTAPSTNPSDVSAADDTATPTAAPPPANKPGCALASAAVVKSTLGITVSEPAESFDATEIECTYRPADGGFTVVVKFRADQDKNSFADYRREFDDRGEPTMDVDGLGDGAYATSSEFGDVVTNTLVARKGSVQELIAAAASIDAEKAFVARVFTSL